MDDKCFPVSIALLQRQIGSSGGDVADGCELRVGDHADDGDFGSGRAAVARTLTDRDSPATGEPRGSR